jgi:hydroxymethylpyrimidine pyrophosphatase-like HAD family hydrolase
VIAGDAEAKKQFALSCDIHKMVAIGNARIDIGMFEFAKISIATLQ